MSVTPNLCCDKTKNRGTYTRVTSVTFSLSYIQINTRQRQWHPIPVLLPGKSHGQRSLVGCSPWGPQESDTTERLHFHFSLSCIGEGNGNPLQFSCLGNSMDRGAWKATIHGVTQLDTTERLTHTPVWLQNIFFKCAQKRICIKIQMIMSRECMFLDSLSCHNKDLE